MGQLEETANPDWVAGQAEEELKLRSNVHFTIKSIMSSGLTRPMTYKF